MQPVLLYCSVCMPSSHPAYGNDGVRGTTLKSFISHTNTENLIKTVVQFYTYLVVKIYLNTKINMVLYLEKV